MKKAGKWFLGGFLMLAMCIAVVGCGEEMETNGGQNNVTSTPPPTVQEENGMNDNEQGKEEIDGIGDNADEAGDLYTEDNNSMSDENGDGIANDVGNGVQELGDGVGTAVEDVGDAVGDALDGTDVQNNNY